VADTTCDELTATPVPHPPTFIQHFSSINFKKLTKPDEQSTVLE